VLIHMGCHIAVRVYSLPKCEYSINVAAVFISNGRLKSVM
jgi:hypothetical protein